MAGRDASECVWLYLRDSAAAAAVRDLLVDGADSVFETGDVTPDILQSLVAARRTAGNLDLALCVSVQDAGEDVTPRPDERIQFVVVRVYDRARGYRNLRVVRIELMKLLRGFFSNLANDARKGILDLQYRGRTGHRWDRLFNIEYESVTFAARVIHEEEGI